MKKDKEISNIVIYQTSNGALALKGDLKKETIWASLDQISSLFDRDKSVISRHIKNIFKDSELDKHSVVAKNATTASDGKTYQVEYYNLDVLISVGYRVNSVVATQFRKWATKTLKKHITQGYTINKKLLTRNYTLFEKALTDIQKISHNKLSSTDILALVKAFSQTWFSLDSFDKQYVQTKKQTQKSVGIEAGKLYQDLEIFKQELIKEKQATEIFGQEKQY